MKYNINKDWLIEQYITMDRTIYEISKEINVPYSTLCRIARDMNIKKEKPYNSKDWLYDQYITQNKQARQIAKELGCSLTTIVHKLSEFNIKRERIESQIYNKELLYDEYIIKDKTQAEIAKEYNVSIYYINSYCKKYGFTKKKPLLTKDFLYNEHIVKHKSMLQIAKETGHNNTSIRKYLDLYGIPVWTCKDNTNEYIDNNDGSTTVNIYNKYGKYVNCFIVDTDKVKKIKDVKWVIVQDNIVKNRPKYRVESGSHPCIVLARFILDVYDENIFIDHCDNNPLNNRVSNLRLASRSNNQSNHDLHINNTSGFAGVSFTKKNNKWEAQIKKNYINYKLGKYEKIEDAVFARYCAEQELFGEFRSNRNDQNILSAINNCSNKDKIKQYVLNIINRTQNKKQNRSDTDGDNN